MFYIFLLVLMFLIIKNNILLIDVGEFFFSYLNLNTSENSK